MHDDVYQQPSLHSLANEGEQFYLDKLRADLEEKRLGEYVVIEPESKAYFVDEDLLKALKVAEKKFPNKFFTIIKIGTFKPSTNNYKFNVPVDTDSHAWTI